MCCRRTQQRIKLSTIENRERLCEGSTNAERQPAGVEKDLPKYI